MRKTSRPFAVLLLLGSAACAHDGMLAPELAPQPASASLVVAPASKPAAPERLTCARKTVAPCAGREPIYIVDGVVMAGSLADIDVLDIATIEVLKTTGPGERPAVLITTRASRAPERS